MKRPGIFLFLLLFLPLVSIGQTTVSTRNGFVLFFSSAPLEDIRATNERVRAVLNIQTGEILIRMRVEDFSFRKTLMQRHFNEDYMESHLFPEAQFSGKISGFDLNGLDDKPAKVFVEGEMTIHGVSRMIREEGNIRKTGNRIICETVFTISVKDYGVKIPRMLMRNIAETVEVTVRLELQ